MRVDTLLIVAVGAGITLLGVGAGAWVALRGVRGAWDVSGPSSGQPTEVVEPPYPYMPGEAKPVDEVAILPWQLEEDQPRDGIDPGADDESWSPA